MVVRKIIAPIAPHLAEELYEHDGNTDRSVFLDTWLPSVSFSASNSLMTGGLAGTCIGRRHGGDTRPSLDHQSIGRGCQESRVSGVFYHIANLHSAIKSIDEAVLTIFAEGEGLRVLEIFCE